MRTRSAAVRAAAAVGAVVVAGALTGCGDGTPAATPASASAPASAAPAPGAPAPLLDGQRRTVLDQPLRFPRQGRVPAVTSRIVVLEPGQRTDRQEYRGPTYVQVLEGQYTVEYAGGVVRDYPEGTAYLEAVDTTLVGRNDGSDPARVLIVQVGSVRQ